MLMAICRVNVGGIIKVKVITLLLAQSQDEAKAAIKNMYPRINVDIITEPDSKRVVIAQASQQEEEKLYWSNEIGWVDYTDATKFTIEEINGMNLPLMKECLPVVLELEA